MNPDFFFDGEPGEETIKEIHAELGPITLKEPFFRTGRRT